MDAPAVCNSSGLQPATIENFAELDFLQLHRPVTSNYKYIFFKLRNQSILYIVQYNY